MSPIALTADVSEQLLRALGSVLDIRQVFPQISAVANQVLPHDRLTMTLHDGQTCIAHAASNDDLQMLDFLAEVGVPTIVALTKIDKLRPRELPERIRELAVQLQLDEEQMIPFSATTNAGRDDLAAAVVSLVEQPSWRQGSDETTAVPPPL